MVEVAAPTGPCDAPPTAPAVHAMPVDRFTDSSVQTAEATTLPATREREEARNG